MAILPKLKLGGFMTEEPGIYAMRHIKPGKVKIGPYTLCRPSEGKIWIQMDDGEGGAFAEGKLADSIKTFYDEHF